MGLKPKINMTLFKGFFICLVLFILVIIAFFAFKAYPNVIDDTGIPQKIESIFNKDNKNNETVNKSVETQNETGN